MTKFNDIRNTLFRIKKKIINNFPTHLPLFFPPPLARAVGWGGGVEKGCPATPGLPLPPVTPPLPPPLLGWLKAWAVRL